MKFNRHRRRVLRGMMQGAVVSVALPFLDCFLIENGTALAATGAPLPVRFGTWFWGLGFTPDRWEPKNTGANYDLPPELKYIEPVKAHINVLSGFDSKLDGKSNLPHKTGNVALRTGTTPSNGDNSEVPSIDVLIADAIGTTTRFRSLDVSATGNPKDSYSFRSGSLLNPSEGSPVALYTRVFGPEFQDPNAADFKPDPRVLMRLSVLSAIKDDRERLVRELGSTDRARLDEYLTSLRQVEQQLDLQLQKPPPAEACAIPKKPGDSPTGYQMEIVQTNHRLMAELIALSLACNQTKVFNMVFSDSGSSLHKAGSSTTHHIYTHEEMQDAQLGYQVSAGWFVERSMEAWSNFVQVLAAVKEGPGSLLDNTLIMAHSDSSFAKAHSVQAIPVMTAGAAGGRLKTGIHVAGRGDAVSRIGLTVQQALGMSVDHWGTGAMQTAKPVSEIVA